MTRAEQGLPQTVSITIPQPLPDAAAAALIELLHDITDTLESQYAAQLRRHYQRPDHRQTELWTDDEPPF